MLRLVLYAGYVLLASNTVFAQLSKYYTLSDSKEFDTIDFFLKASAANCLINRSVEETEPLTIFGNPDLGKIQPSFTSKVINGTSHSRLVLNQHYSGSLGDGFAFAVFRSDEENNIWRIHYTDDKVYRLNLNYGVGNADIDLTGISVHQLKINSGSANIIVGYDDDNLNPIQMDTFFIKADFGSVVARHMEGVRAKNVITEVGFGNVMLDFRKKQKERCKINAHVGAGNLEVVLPKDKAPIIIYVKDSPLCAVKIADDFEEVEDNVFVNMNYNSDADNLLTFHVDVALGMVKFKYEN